MTRKVLYEKVEHGYRMRIVEAPVGAVLIVEIGGKETLVESARCLAQVRSGQFTGKILVRL